MRERVIVAGGGPVGLAAAVGLARAGLDVDVVERDAPRDWHPPEHFDLRVYALSPASIEGLARLGVHLHTVRAAPVYAMQVWGDRTEAPMVLQRAMPLATIVEHGALMQALHAAAKDAVAMHSGAEVRQWCQGREGQLELSDGRTMSASLVVAAEGRRSAVRDAAGIGIDTVDYASKGVVANFACATPHRDIARQWFLKDSILALLPLPGARVSMVWSLPNAAAEALMHRTPEEMARAVSEAAGLDDTELTTLTSPLAFPLARQMAQEWVRPGLALVGDAAHTVHPLAGQGVNLGFGDAFELAHQINTRSRFSSVGDLAVLRRYARARREAAVAMGALTQGLRNLYLGQGETEAWLRNRGLDLLERMPRIKGRLIDAAVA